jgi:hypothetical protein
MSGLPIRAKGRRSVNANSRNGALHEATEVDPRSARYVNDNLADYLIPVNADVD